MPLPWTSASPMQVSIASHATDWPSFLHASQVWQASNRDGSRRIVARGTQPPAFEPKWLSRSRALIALCVRMPWRVAAVASRAASTASVSANPRAR